MAERIGFLGPGLMGKGIVKNLLKKGYPVMVYAHRDGLKLEDLQQRALPSRGRWRTWGQEQHRLSLRAIVQGG